MGKIRKYLIFINPLNEKTYSGINNDFNIQETGDDILEVVEKIENRIKEKIVKIFLKGENIPESIDMKNANKYSGKSDELSNSFILCMDRHSCNWKKSQFFSGAL